MRVKDNNISHEQSDDDDANLNKCKCCINSGYLLNRENLGQGKKWISHEFACEIKLFQRPLFKEVLLAVNKSHNILPLKVH